MTVRSRERVHKEMVCPQRLKPQLILRTLRRGLKPRPFKARSRAALKLVNRISRRRRSQVRLRSHQQQRSLPLERPQVFQTIK